MNGFKMMKRYADQLYVERVFWWNFLNIIPFYHLFPSGDTLYASFSITLLGSTPYGTFITSSGPDCMKMARVLREIFLPAN
jgi:uncharacterized membrane protein